MADRSVSVRLDLTWQAYRQSLDQAAKLTDSLAGKAEQVGVRFQGAGRDVDRAGGTMTTRVGGVSREVLGLSGAVSRAGGSINRELGGVSAGFDRAGTRAATAGQAMGDAFVDAGARIRGDATRTAAEVERAFAGIDVGSLGGAAVGAGLAGTLEDATVSAGLLRAQLGLVGEEAAEFDRAAQQVYRGGFGASMADAATQTGLVRQALGLTGDELVTTTQGVASISDAFGHLGADTTNLVDGVRGLVANFPGLDEAHALDLISDAFQRGVGGSGDLGDTLREYPSTFTQLGLSADDMFATLSAGIHAGARDTDYIADAFKEFGIRVNTVGDTGQDAIRRMFPPAEAERIIAQFGQGGDAARDAFFTVSEALVGVSDQQERYTTSVDLFGTKAEDLGSALVPMLQTLLDSRDATLDVAGATDSLGAQYTGTAATLESWKRALQTEVLEPLQALGPAFGTAVDWSVGLGTAFLAAKGAGVDLGSTLSGLGGWGGVAGSAAALTGTAVLIGGISSQYEHAMGLAYDFAEGVAAAGGPEPMGRLQALNAELADVQARLEPRWWVIPDLAAFAGDEDAEKLAALTGAIDAQRQAVVEAAREIPLASAAMTQYMYWEERGFDAATAYALAHDASTRAIEAGINPLDRAGFATAAFESRLGDLDQASHASMGATVALAERTQSYIDAASEAEALSPAWEAAIHRQASAMHNLAIGIEEPLAFSEEWATTFGGFIDHAGAYGDALEGLADDATVTFDTLLASYEEQAVAQEQWATNFATAAARIPADVLPELERLAAESPEALAELASGTDAQLQEWVGYARRAAPEFTAAIRDQLEAAAPVLADVAGRFGRDIADAMGAELAKGVVTAEDVAYGYQVALVTGLNPLLVALGETEIAVPGRPARTSIGGGDVAHMWGGGRVAGSGPDVGSVPAMLTPGEYVVRRPVVERLGVGAFDLLNRGDAAIQHLNVGGLTLNGGGRVEGDVVAVPHDYLRGLAPLEEAHTP